MNCREFLKRLPDLLDRDPDPAATDDMIQHADGCPTCAAVLEAARDALSAVTPSRPLTASPGLKEKTMKRIIALDSQPNAVPTAPSARRSTLLAHPWRYAAAVTIVAIAVFVLATLKGGGSSAFAQVMEQIRNATSRSYVLTTMPDKGMSMRTKTYYKDPGMLRMDFEVLGTRGASTSIVDINKKKLITIVPAAKQCLTFDLTGETEPSQQGGEADVFERLRELPDSGGEPIGTKKIDGVEAIGFRASQGGTDYTIWADPTDKHLLLVEFKNENIDGMKGQMSDFNFDAQLDDSLFSLEPPPGYTVVDGKSFNLETPSEETFIRFLRTWAEETEGDLFLPSLDQAGLMKAGMARKKTAPPLPTAMSSEFMKRTNESTIGLMFVMKMTPENDFHYAGQGVSLGDAQTPICWYKPTGAQNYHVIYGDLSVRDVAPQDLPVPPA